ncbi:MAG: molybdopterin-dependent oxidoreductase, partial [Planctomycetota bacterium]
HFPPSKPADDPSVFKMYAEKAPNARGVRRVLEAVTGNAPLEFDDFKARHLDETGAIIMTANYHFPSNWAEDGLLDQLEPHYVVLIDTLESALRQTADVVLPSATWTEKAGTFENATGRLQTFEQAIPTQHESKSEGQIASDLSTLLAGGELDRVRPVGPEIYGGVSIVDEGPGQVPQATDVALIPRAKLFNAADVRAEAASRFEGLRALATDVETPAVTAKQRTDVEVVEL